MDTAGTIEKYQRPFCNPAKARVLQARLLSLLGLCGLQQVAYRAVRDLRLQVCRVSDLCKLLLRCDDIVPLLLHRLLSRPEPRTVSIRVSTISKLSCHGPSCEAFLRSLFRQCLAVWLISSQLLYPNLLCLGGVLRVHRPHSTCLLASGWRALFSLLLRLFLVQCRPLCNDCREGPYGSGAIMSSAYLVVPLFS